MSLELVKFIRNSSIIHALNYGNTHTPPTEENMVTLSMKSMLIIIYNI